MPSTYLNQPVIHGVFIFPQEELNKTNKKHQPWVTMSLSKLIALKQKIIYRYIRWLFGVPKWLYCNSYSAHHSSNSVPSTSTPPVRETSHLPTAVGELMVTKDDLGWWSLYGIFYVTYNYLLAYSYMYINACLFTSIILIVLVFICQFIMFLFFIWAADWYLVLTARADSSRGFTSRADQRPSRLTWFGVSHA